MKYFLNDVLLNLHFRYQFLYIRLYKTLSSCKELSCVLTLSKDMEYARTYISEQIIEYFIIKTLEQKNQHIFLRQKRS